MTMTEPRTEPDWSELRDDGDTLDLGDGRTLRLRIEVDQDMKVGDFDECYGRVGFDEVDRYTGNRRRPEGFDGNAERLYYGNDGPWWWQPPAEGPKRGTPEFARFRDHVSELLAFGFKGIILELLEGEDAYGWPIVRASASLWGIDTLDEWPHEGNGNRYVVGGYLAELLPELWGELS